jgi:6-phosphogluconate dehydrogenase
MVYHSMMKYIFILVLLFIFSTPIYANLACVELSVVAQTVDRAHQNGIPKIAVQAAMKMSGIKTKTMKAFVSALVIEAYSDKRVANTEKKKAAEDFSYRIFTDCEKLMKVHDNLR